MRGGCAFAGLCGTARNYCLEVFTTVRPCALDSVQIPYTGRTHSRITLSRTRTCAQFEKPCQSLVPLASLAAREVLKHKVGQGGEDDAESTDRQEEAARPRHLERPRHRSNLNVPAPRNPGGPQIKQRLLCSFMTDVHSLCSWAGWAPVRHGPRPPFDGCVGEEQVGAAVGFGSRLSPGPSKNRRKQWQSRTRWRRWFA